VIRKRQAIPDDAQKMIKTAASRAGMPVSEWLNAVILDAAADEGVKRLRNVFHDRAGTSKPAKYDYASIYSRLDVIAAKIESLTQGGSAFDGAGPARGGTAIIDPDQQDAIFDRLSDLLDMPVPGDWHDDAPRRKSAMR
jgi:hypothetical protein